MTAKRAMCWETPNKRSALGLWVRHRRSDPNPTAFQSTVRRPNPRKGVDQHAAASLLHAVAFGLRAPLASDQVEGLISLLPWLFERPLRSKV